MSMNFHRETKISHAEGVQRSNALYELLDKALEAKGAAEDSVRYKDRAKSLGAGRVGHPNAPVPYERGCERALWYEMKQTPVDPGRELPAKIRRIFSMGHAIETIIIDNFRAAGFTILTHKPLPADAPPGYEPQQYGFALSPDPVTRQARYKGFCDGIVIAGPASIDGIEIRYPFVLECKGINNKKFDKFLMEGIERSHPAYYGQVQQYENFLQLYANPALIAILNRDTGELRTEFVPFSKTAMQAIIERAARIIEAKGPLTLARAAPDFDHIPCKWCDFRLTCEKNENERAVTAGAGSPGPLPSWLAGAKS